MEQLSLGSRALESLGIALFEVSGLSVGQCEVEFPTFCRALHVRIAGLRLSLKQRQLPKVHTALNCLSPRGDTVIVPLLLALPLSSRAYLPC